jgi:uncharacterized protein YqjF (DUF2071 family)
MRLLKRHPFPVVAWFDKVVALSFAFPEDILRSLVPDGLEIDAYEGFGFVTVAMVWARKMRPEGFPEFAGQDFFLAGYRIFTRLHDGPAGRRLRGLTILRSDTDKRSMVWLGNLMTGYRYRHVRLRTAQSGSSTRVETSLADGTPTLEVVFDVGPAEVSLPAGSPFPDWRTARRFAGPMPFTFSPEADGNFVVIEGSRDTWTPRPVAVERWDAGLFREAPLNKATPVLANSFMVENIAYRWSKGRIVKPGGAS